MPYPIEGELIDNELYLRNFGTPLQIHREQLADEYQDKLKVNRFLNRSLISFQANKSEPFYRWFKYKEGFSTIFIKHILELFGSPNSGQIVLDPFSGIGTTITTSVENGFDAIGIELLPPGILATNARIAGKKLKKKQLEDLILSVSEIDFLNTNVESKYYFRHLTITKNAFPQETEVSIANFKKFLTENCSDDNIKSILTFAGSSILEDVSFTRKDGQYLRWDNRSSRKLKSKFDKGEISDFKSSLLRKLENIKEDIDNNALEAKNKHQIVFGSCLTNLQNIPSESIDIVITSPPYCNRYDYTRTYALELAFSGVNDIEIKKLRQTLLSATVENKSKYHQLKHIYEQLDKSEVFERVSNSFKTHFALNEILEELNVHKSELNNKNIPDMVSNYFFEMNFVINELARVLRTNGKIIMVNDNVQYNGSEIPVDLILSDFAVKAGLKTDVIWVLERGKGNSSQQMGIHGRNEIRKCVYVWSK